MCDKAEDAGEFVVVRRQWNDDELATYRFEDVRRPHWDTMSGGVYAPTPQPFLHAYVSCEGAVDGEVRHSGRHGRCPHSIKVCIVKKDNEKAIFQKLVDIAGPKPPRVSKKVRRL